MSSSSVPSIASLLPKPQKIQESSTRLASPSNAVKDTTLIDFSSKPVESSTRPFMLNHSISEATVPIEYTDQGLINYHVIAKVGHEPDRQVFSGYSDSLPKDLVLGDDGLLLEFKKPPMEEIQNQLAITKKALESILNSKLAATQPKNIKKPGEGEFLKYEPKQTMVNSSSTEKMNRIIKMVDLPVDPLEPPKFQHKRIPRPPASPPAPVLHSPPRKVTVEEQAAWKIPPCISNWKNPKGYTIPLDKRLAFDGTSLNEAVVNERFSGFAEALYLAEKHAKEEVDKRNTIEAELLTREQQQQDLKLQEAARSALESSSFSKVGKARDVSEKVDFGKVQPVSIDREHEGMFDTRLFDRTSGVTSGYADDDTYTLYDKPLFAAASATIDAIYRPRGGPKLDKELYGENGDTENVSYSVPQPSRPFQGTTTDDRTASQNTIQPQGPIIFERAPDTLTKSSTIKNEDPYGLDQFLLEARKKTNQSSYKDTRYEEDSHRSKKYRQ